MISLPYKKNTRKRCKCQTQEIKWNKKKAMPKLNITLPVPVDALIATGLNRSMTHTSPSDQYDRDQRNENPKKPAKQSEQMITKL